jgi:host factor-I protein
LLVRYNSIGPVRILKIVQSQDGKKMDKPAQNIQDSFLNNARKEKGLVTIYLLSGVKLSGRIKSFDKYSLVLETSNQEQLIFKHAISTVVTTRAIQQHAPANNHQSTSPQLAQAAMAGQHHEG